MALKNNKPYAQKHHFFKSADFEVRANESDEKSVRKNKSRSILDISPEYFECGFYTFFTLTAIAVVKELISWTFETSQLFITPYFLALILGIILTDGSSKK